MPFLNYIVLIGGMRQVLSPDNAVEVYSLKTWKRWKELKVAEDFLGPFMGHCLVRHNEAGISVLGGIEMNTLGEATMSEYFYKLRVNCDDGRGMCIETKLPETYIGAWKAAFGVVNGQILAYSNQNNQSVWISRDIDDNNWKIIGKMTQTRDHGSTVALSQEWSMYTTNCA